MTWKITFSQKPFMKRIGKGMLSQYTHWTTVLQWLKYHWKLLPQEMLNSPNLCQYFVQKILEIICKQFLQSILLYGWHFLTDSVDDVLENMFKVTQNILPCCGSW